jgi:Spirocyclase AveC-like
VSLDGMLALVWLQLYWICDPLFDYAGNMFTFNAYAFNRGSWVTYVPGWLAPAHPGAMVPEPFLWVAPIYVYICFPGTVAMCWLMKKVTARWNLGALGSVTVCWLFSLVLITVIECGLWMRLGLYTWAGGLRDISVFAGRYYQFPLNETLFWGTCWTAMGAMRYFRNDHGETVPERGLTAVAGGEYRRQLTRYFALFGAGFTCYLSAYTIPQVTFFGTHQDTWPKAIQERSYFNDHICGRGTDMICPGPTVPIFTRGSVYLSPRGQLVIPRGKKLPRSP